MELHNWNICDYDFVSNREYILFVGFNLEDIRRVIMLRCYNIATSVCN